MRLPRLTAMCLALGLLFVATRAAEARRGDGGGGGARSGGGPFGLGIMLGAPTGLAGKYYLGHSAKPLAIDFGLGYLAGFQHDHGLHIFVDVLWHPVILVQNSDFTMPLYLGLGGRLLVDNDDRWCDRFGCYYDDDETHIGLRAPLGILFDLNKVPIDIFIEVALVIDFIIVDNGPYYNDYYDDDLVYFNGAIGLRYYF